MVALGALIFGVRAKQGSSAAVASAAFAVTAIGMGRHWTDLRHGMTSVRMHPGDSWALHPAPFVPHFAIVAAAGAIVALALAIWWLLHAAGAGADAAAE